MIRSIIIDDEQPARESLKNYLVGFCPEVEIISMADSVKTGLEAIRELSPALVFLDIEMPDGNGFDLLKQLETISFKIIFVTAFTDYAINAIKFHAVDYLVKPVNITELQNAVKKVREELDQHIFSQNLEELKRYLHNPEEKIRKIVIPDVKGFVVLELQQILYCEADGYCTNFILADDRKITSSRNLKYYEELISDFDFLRVHHSYLINTQYIISYLHEGTIVLKGNKSVPLGNSFKKRFLEIFEGMK
jgi:two-component system LytT family response regulator